MSVSSTWDRMTPQQRVSAVNIDIMNNKDFCTLSGIVMMGDIKIEPTLPTAATNGVDVFYGTEFLMSLNRKQLRFVQLHEALHKALRHCLDYDDIVKKYPRLSNIAMDYVVNAFIEQTDPSHQFIEHPDKPEPLLDKRFYDRSFVDVLQELLKEQQERKQQSKPEQGDGEPQSGEDEGDGCQGGEGGDGDDGLPQTLDEHRAGEKRSEEETQQIGKDIQDALNHGDMVQKRLAGSSGGGNPLSGLGVKRDTDWRSALREWIEEVSAGDEYSRFVPPSKRFLPLGILMPSHFDVAAGEIGILCDTSGSMGPVYPLVFGEIARIAEHANPERVRIIWWDTQVRGEQVFERGQYELIGKQLKPAGGGGTTPSCVATYLSQKQYKLTGAIWLTDGYLDSCPSAVCGNELWGVVDNDHFRPAHGKVLRIHS